MNILVNIFNNSKKINPDRSIHLYIETMVYNTMFASKHEPIISSLYKFSRIKLCAEYNFMKIQCIYENQALFYG